MPNISRSLLNSEKLTKSYPNTHILTKFNSISRKEKLLACVPIALRSLSNKNKKNSKSKKKKKLKNKEDSFINRINSWETYLRALAIITLMMISPK